VLDAEGVDIEATAEALRRAAAITPTPLRWNAARTFVVATDVENLHGANNLSKATALTETGAVVNGRTDTPNMHDILTGSQPDGRVIAGNVNTTCGNWTQSGDGSAMLGHADRTGLDDSVPAKSWNSSHMSRGCSPDALKATGGAGLFYCFAADSRGCRGRDRSGAASAPR